MLPKDLRNRTFKLEKSQFDALKPSMIPLLISLLSLMVALASVGVSYVQTAMLSRQTEIYEKQLETARDQNKMTFEQNAAFKEQDKRGSRAYIGFESASGMMIEALPRKIPFSINFKNYGKSKAQELEIHFNARVLQEDENAHYDVQIIQSPSMHNDVELDPEVSDVRSQSFHLEGEDVAKLDSVYGTYVVYGYILYTDIFKEVHNTNLR